MACTSSLTRIRLPRQRLLLPHPGVLQSAHTHCTTRGLGSVWVATASGGVAVARASWRGCCRAAPLTGPTMCAQLSFNSNLIPVCTSVLGVWWCLSRRTLPKDSHLCWIEQRSGRHVTHGDEVGSVESNKTYTSLSSTISCDSPAADKPNQEHAPRTRRSQTRRVFRPNVTTIVLVAMVM